VYDAVFWVHHAEVSEAEVGSIFCEGVDLGAAHGVGNLHVLVVSGGVVVGHAEYALWAKAFETALAHAFEGLRACHFVTVKAVNV
jgi:hypothetical protein